MSVRVNPFNAEIKRLWPEIGALFEIGAHRGADVREASLLWPETTIYAVEADAHNYKVLTSENNICPQAHYIWAAMTENDGDFVMFNTYGDIEGIGNDVVIHDNQLYNISGQGSVLNLGPVMKQSFKVKEVFSQYQVPTISLDGLVMRTRPKAPFVLLVDVQGGEGGVLAGGQDTLASPDCVAIVLEWSEGGSRSLYEGETPRSGLVEILSRHGWKEHMVIHQLKGISGDSLFVRW